MTEAPERENLTEKKVEDRNDRIDAVISVIISLGAIVFLAGSQAYAGVRSGSSDPGAALWPRVILVILLLVSLINIFNIYRRNSSIVDRSSVDALLGSIRTNSRPSNLRAETKQYAVSILLIAGYLVILTDWGFLISTTVFLALFVWTLGYRSIPKLIAFSIAVSVIVFILFRNFMNIALPYGTGIFRELGIFMEGLI